MGMEPEGLLHTEGHASLIKVPKETREGPSPKQTMEPSADLIVNGAAEDEVLLSLGWNNWKIIYLCFVNIYPCSPLLFQLQRFLSLSPPPQKTPLCMSEKT